MELYLFQLLLIIGLTLQVKSVYSNFDSSNQQKYFRKIDNFEVTAVSPNALNCTWDPIQSSVPIHYLYISWVNGGSSPEYKMLDGGNDVFYVIENLVPCTSYDVSMFEKFDDDSSGHAAEGRSKTLVERPEKPVCTVNSVTSKSILIEMTEQGNCQTDHFYLNGTETILWPPNDPNNPTTNIDYIIVNSSSYRIKNLVPYSSYDLEMYPSNDAGYGDPCILSQQTLEADPGPPANLSILSYTDDSIKVRWDVPELMNGIIDNYKVTCTAPDGTVQYVEEQSTSTTIANLQKCTYYNISVQAHTSVGWGTYSDSKGVETTAVDNAKPAIEICEQSSDSDIKVTWVFDGACEDATPDFSISWIADVLWSNDTYNGQETVNKYEFTISGESTIPFTDYKICVNSEETCCHVTTAEEAPGDPPTIEGISETSQGSIVTVAPPKALNGILIHYKVHIDGKDQVDDHRQIFIESLSSCSEFEGSVSAVTKGGEGPQESFKFKTLSAPTAVSCNTLSKKAISVSWIQSTESCFNDTYRLTWEGKSLWNSPDLDIPEQNSDLQETSTTINDLTTYARVNFKILSHPKDNIKYALDVECDTEEDVPSKVEDLHYEEIENHKSVRLNWKPPTEIPGLLQLYECSCFNNDTNDDEYNSYNISALEQSLKIDDLDFDNEYNCFIKAMTNAGFGPPSSTVHINITDNVLMIVIISVVVSLVVIVIIGGVSFYMYKRRSKEPPSDYQYDRRRSTFDMILDNFRIPRARSQISRPQSGVYTNSHVSDNEKSSSYDNNNYDSDSGISTTKM